MNNIDFSKIDNAVIENLKKYLNSLSCGEEKGVWEQKIVNTKRPCIMVKSKDIASICKEILKGDIIAFINSYPIETHTDTIIISSLIPKIKDFDTQKKYLLEHSLLADNWSTIDSIKIHPTHSNKSKYFNFAKTLTTHVHPFTRRLGVVIMLKLLNFNDLHKEIANEIKLLYNEKEYYVNMAVAWLVSELFVKGREVCLTLYENGSLNTFVNNKSIQKCRDSYRVSAKDKEYLLKFKI
ncbi:MAG: DNA alkylation repair protein [Clostridia bacterium]|nr:DNA alkylation repair protein [Clostridia bacterium]